MQANDEQSRSGAAYLETLTALLRRSRLAHPTKGQFESGEMLWWWAEIPRSTDTLDQLFWFDDNGEPLAAVILTEWPTWIAMDPIVLPDASPALIAHVVQRGLAHAEANGLQPLQLEVDREDAALHSVLGAHGFSLAEEAMVESWLAAGDRPEVSDLAEGYRLMSRAEDSQVPHHMAARHYPEIEERLAQTPLYRPDLDLVIRDRDHNTAAYGMCWYDPATSTGVVEPMRTEEAHQRRGLARHLLTAGVELLAAAGAERIKIVFEPDNPASSKLYPDVGFVPVKQTDTWAR